MVPVHPQNPDVPDTDALLRRVQHGDSAAGELLLVRHRDRLKGMVHARLDPRLRARLDPSDVVQEVLTVAAKRLPDFAETMPIPFYPWLRQIAWEHLAQAHRRHVQAARRSVRREQAQSMCLSDESELMLAQRVAAGTSSPSAALQRREWQQIVRQALEEIEPADRELIILRYVEMLSNAEIAAVLGVSEGAVKMRHLRAIRRLRSKLSDDGPG